MLCCRPVPLEMSFAGVTVANMTARNTMMNQICYDKVGTTQHHRRPDSKMALPQYLMPNIPDLDFVCSNLILA